MKPSTIRLLAALGSGAVILVTCAVLFRPSGSSVPRHQAAPSDVDVSASSSARVPISLPVRRIAAQFACTCGACGGEPLESCSCPAAVEERAFISGQLAAGLSETQVTDAVEAKYGGRKTSPTGLTGTSEQTAVQPEPGTRLATAADRVHIVSHFRCPCNQCDMDELSECDCPHPRGAQEVKQFIDDTIAQHQHSVGQIVTLVEQRYGGRIR